MVDNRMVMLGTLLTVFGGVSLGMGLLGKQLSWVFVVVGILLLALCGGEKVTTPTKPATFGDQPGHVHVDGLGEVEVVTGKGITYNYVTTLESGRAVYVRCLPGGSVEVYERIGDGRMVRFEPNSTKEALAVVAAIRRY